MTGGASFLAGPLGPEMIITEFHNDPLGRESVQYLTLLHSLGRAPPDPPRRLRRWRACRRPAPGSAGRLIPGAAAILGSTAP